MKQCWNICCICWEATGLSNCNATDISVPLCRLSDVNLKHLLDLVKIIYNPKKTSELILQLDSLLKIINDKLPKKDSEKIRDQLHQLISDLQKKDFIV